MMLRILIMLAMAGQMAVGAVDALQNATIAQAPAGTTGVVTVAYVQGGDGLIYPVCMQGCAHWMNAAVEPAWGVGYPTTWQAANNYIAMVNRWTGSSWVPLPAPQTGN